MFGSLAPQHMPGLHLGVSCTPEDKTTDWWQQHDRALAIKNETGKLPTSSHKQVGHWVRLNTTALIDILKRESIRESQGARINGARRSALRKLGYPLDGSMPGFIPR